MGNGIRSAGRLSIGINYQVISGWHVDASQGTRESGGLREPSR
jgi:hypothetical protein